MGWGSATVPVMAPLDIDEAEVLVATARKKREQWIPEVATSSSGGCSLLNVPGEVAWASDTLQASDLKSL